MGRTGNVTNVKDVLKENYNNINVKGKTKASKWIKRSGSPQSRIRRAQRIADDLTRKFGPRSKNCYRYFCKCAYNLPENVIWDCYEDCMRSKVTNNLAYFLSATKAQPQMQ